MANWHTRSDRVAVRAEYDEPRPEPSDESDPATDVRYASQRVAIRSSVAEDPPRAVPLAADEVSVAGLLAKHASDHEDHLLAHFFSSPPPEPSDALEEPYHLPMSAGSRRAMWSSVWIFGIALAGIGGYTAYQQLVMPAPVELGSPLTADLVPGVPVPMQASASVARAPAQPSAALRASLAEPLPVISPAAAQAAPAVAAALPTPTQPAVQGEPAVASAAAPARVIELPATNIGGAALAQAQAPAVGAIVAPPSAAQTPEAASGEAASVAPVAEPEASGGTLPSYDDLVEVGRAFARKGRNEQAREAFQRALDAQPNASPALAGMAYVYLNMGDQGLAKLFATRALDADKTNSQGWIVLGAALEMLGDRAGAREAYRKCATDAVGSYVGECRNLAR